MRRKSRYAAKRQEISDMMATGATYRQIAEMLAESGIKATYSGLYEYCQRIDRPEITPAPMCKTCDGRFTVPARRKGGTVSVCIPGRLYIPGSCLTSPMECPRRNHENRINQ